MGFLMGIYHQGGIVPAQLAMRGIVESNTLSQGVNSMPEASVFWWKTYSPPHWLLGADTNATHIDTFDLMGMPGLEMITALDKAVPRCATTSPVYLVAPTSASFLDDYISPSSLSEPHSPNLQLYRLWTHRKHLNLDDLDFGDDGVLNTLNRVVGRRGLGVWSVRRACT
ncbi:GPI mannosyltransferase 4 [Penicillium atrosanguineum]|nr:GPI mannosyltransferase 4 [Penicillium atrosanguineum]KAJ5137050.1 GPI mannosyltransferase 4 [Penicillium atrosanguineum]